jgi:hypothetical protein
MADRLAPAEICSPVKEDQQTEMLRERFALTNMACRRILAQQVMKKLDAVKEYLTEMASKGGRARATKYDKATLSRWAKLGGRPPKKGSKKGKSK